MYLHKKYVKNLLFLTIVGLISGCGTTTQTEVPNIQTNQKQLDEENYFKVSQYIYSRQKAIKKAQRDKTKRDYPQQAMDTTSSNKNILKVQSKNGRVEIKQGHKTILVNVDNKIKKVVVMYKDGKTESKKSTTLEKFNNLNEEIN